MNDSSQIPEDKKEELLQRLGVGAPVEQAAVTERPTLDLDKVEIPSGSRHLYEQATLEIVEDGTEHWVVEQDEWETRHKTYSGAGVDKNGEAKGLANYLTQISNTGAWQIHSVLPNGSGMCVVVQRRRVKLVLPDPIPIEDVKVESPTDTELAEVETKAEEWAKGQGLTGA